MVVAGKDHHHLRPVGLHQLDEAVDSLLAKGIMLVIHQGVGLINEENATEGLLHFRLHLQSGLTWKEYGRLSLAPRFLRRRA